MKIAVEILAKNGKEISDQVHKVFEAFIETLPNSLIANYGYSVVQKEPLRYGFHSDGNGGNRNMFFGEVIVDICVKDKDD